MVCNIPLESYRWELQLYFRSHLDSRSSHKVMGLQNYKSPSWHNFGTPIWNPGEKSHLDVGLVERCRVYYKGEGGGFPQVRPVVSLVCPCCPWLVLAPKLFQLCINHLVWVMCSPMWVSEACQLFLVPSRSSNTPLYPSKCCELGSVPRLLPFPLSFTWTHFWVLQGVGNVVMARDMMAKEGAPTDLKLCLIASWIKDAHRYNVSTVDEVVALMVGDGFEAIDRHDVVVAQQADPF